MGRGCGAEQEKGGGRPQGMTPIPIGDSGVNKGCSTPVIPRPRMQRQVRTGKIIWHAVFETVGALMGSPC